MVTAGFELWHQLALRCTICQLAQSLEHFIPPTNSITCARALYDCIIYIYCVFVSLCPCVFVLRAIQCICSVYYIPTSPFTCALYTSNQLNHFNSANSTLQKCKRFATMAIPASGSIYENFGVFFSLKQSGTKTCLAYVVAYV